MKQIFQWFYCLGIPDAVLLVLLGTLLFLALRVKFRERKCWRPIAAGILLCWTGVILLGTLGTRSSTAAASKPVLIPFYSYYLAFHGGSRELYRTNFMNTVLFYPAGLLGIEVLPKRLGNPAKVFLILSVLLAVSAGIEYCQYRFSLGLAEVDDLIHNGIGALLGALISLPQWEAICRKFHRRVS